MFLAEGHAVALQELRCNLALLDSSLDMFCVCVCVCVCGHVYVVYEDTNLYNDMVWHRYYKEKVIYEDIFSVPII